MKSEENWPRGFRGEVVQKCGHTTDGWTKGHRRRMASDHNRSSRSFSSGELINKKAEGPNLLT